MIVEKQIQFFQMSMEDLSTIIKKAVTSAIQNPKIINMNNSLDKSNTNPEDDVLTREEVKNILKVSYPTLWKYNNDGTLKVKSKIGRRVYYSKKDLTNLLNDVA
ncbi:helix-turn-helix transcriptional regulator [Polaribacter sp.]|uniref:helix-turn-helix transcriptional regulator n=1 Tax=Polaribacter sp. TaxID=1920175 RepID=UPI003EF0CA37